MSNCLCSRTGNEHMLFPFEYLLNLHINKKRQMLIFMSKCFKKAEIGCYQTQFVKMAQVLVNVRCEKMYMVRKVPDTRDYRIEFYYVLIHDISMNTVNPAISPATLI